MEGVFNGVGSHTGSHLLNQSETQGLGGQEELKPDPPTPKGQALDTRERPKKPLQLATWLQAPCFTKEA